MDNLIEKYYPSDHFLTEEHTASIVRKCQVSSSGEVQILARRLAETHDDLQATLLKLDAFREALEVIRDGIPGPRLHAANVLDASAVEKRCPMPDCPHGADCVHATAEEERGPIPRVCECQESCVYDIADKNIFCRQYRKVTPFELSSVEAAHPACLSCGFIFGHGQGCARVSEGRCPKCHALTVDGCVTPSACALSAHGSDGDE